MQHEGDRIAKLRRSPANRPGEPSYKQACLWKDGSMVLRWVASAPLATEESFRRIMGRPQLWMLESSLDDPSGK